MAIYIYPPVSLSITSGPTSFVKDGATVTVNEDTITPANSRPLPIKVLNSAGVQVDPATEAKQDVGNTSLSSIDGKMTTLNAKDFSTSAKQDTGNASLSSIDTKMTDGNQKTKITDGAGTVNTKQMGTAILGTDVGLIVQAVIHGLNSGGGGSYVDVKVTPSGAIVADVTGTVTANAGTNLNTSALSLEATQLLIKAKTDNIDVALSTVAKDATLLSSNTLIGAVTEAAPGTDTTSSGLNGRLQRIAQRLTSLISLLPTALGQGTMATSLKVVLPSDQSAIPTSSTEQSVSGTVTNSLETVGVTRSRATVGAIAPTASRKKLMIKPSLANTGKIYIGGSTVTIANGMEIIGPDRLEFNFDTGDYYLISDTAAQSVEIIEKV